MQKKKGKSTLILLHALFLKCSKVEGCIPGIIALAFAFLEQ